ncbi:MAG: hypothetical protein LBS25_10210 [Candidatus Symbiothrix sp.]|jgi:hypothetical protein|nr:hypothetical protein [Candidatus Symbiothrix sp.]
MKRFFFFFSLSIIFPLSSHAQALEEAFRLYSEKQYTEVVPLLEAALQSKKKDAAKQFIEIYPLLGEIYYMQYRFQKSADAYKHFIDLLATENRKQEIDSIQILMDKAGRAARMLHRCEDIQMIDSVIIDKKHFLETYLLTSESGSLHWENGTIVYENPLHDKRYFAEKQSNSKSCLFSEIRLQDEWSDRKQLSIPCDSMADLNFPFALPDGFTLYFASTDKSSIGGYDLFVTRYNLNNDTWLTPNQLGMPFNSIYNDYLLAIDEPNRIGYFATDRFQNEENVIVYTFIPNEEFISIETENENERIDRAQIASIRATWKPDTDYAASLAQIRQSIKNEQAQLEYDFAFPIDDNRIYHSLIDFKKAAALQAFRKSQELKSDMQLIKKELDNLRLEYSQAGATKKQILRATILSKEEKLQSLYRQSALFEKNARNFEIK